MDAFPDPIRNTINPNLIKVASMNDKGNEDQVIVAEPGLASDSFVYQL